jgi:hypothetical protein
MSTSLGRWRPMSVVDATARFAPFGAAWWIAGGVAIDLFVGRRTRPHGDLDVEVLSRDQERVRTLLAGLELAVAHHGRLRDWEPGEQLVPGWGSLWCRSRPDGPWELQVLLADADGDAWLFRRDPRVRRPLAAVIRHAPSGAPHIAPEVQLLFKAKSVRPVDQADFDAAFPLLDPDAREWLAAALAVAHPDHPWRRLLR